MLPQVTNGSGGAGISGGWTFYSYFGNGTLSNPTTFNSALGSLYGYIKSANVYVCPSDPVGQLQAQSYAINSCMTPSNAVGLAPPYWIAHFNGRDPTQIALLSEEANGGPSNSTDDGYQLAGSNGISARHSNGSNLIYLDGHAKWAGASLLATYNPFTGNNGATCP